MTGFTGTQGRILDILKRNERTVEQLATRLRITKNAVRSQLKTLEAVGWVHPTGTAPGRRRPAVLYGVAPALARAESRAYAPVLAELLRVLEERLDPEVITDTMRTVGSRLAAAQPRPAGGRSDGFRRAHAVLGALGATTDLIIDDGGYRLQGYACPLGLAVRESSSICEAVRTLLSEIVGEELAEHCSRDGQPRCCFSLAS